MHRNEKVEYKNVEICRQTFAINKILSRRETLPLMTNALPNALLPKNFMGIFVSNASFGDILESISTKSAEYYMEEILKEERYLLRAERKRPWALKTRRPFRGYIDKVQITFREKIKLAENVAMEIDIPCKKTNKGRPPVYDKKNFLQHCW